MIFLVLAQVKDICQQCGLHEKGRTFKEWGLGFWIIYSHRQVKKILSLGKANLKPSCPMRRKGSGHRNSLQSIATCKDWYCHLLKMHLEEASSSPWLQSPHLWNRKVGPGRCLECLNGIIKDTLKICFVYCTNRDYNNGNVRVKRVKKSSKVLPT